jgi:hypothetical protein
MRTASGVTARHNSRGSSEIHPRRPPFPAPDRFRRGFADAEDRVLADEDEGMT